MNDFRDLHYLTQAPRHVFKKLANCEVQREPLIRIKVDKALLMNLVIAGETYAPSAAGR
jgi:hypothetical protein